MASKSCQNWVLLNVLKKRLINFSLRLFIRYIGCFPPFETRVRRDIRSLQMSSICHRGVFSTFRIWGAGNLRIEKHLQRPKTPLNKHRWMSHIFFFEYPKFFLTVIRIRNQTAVFRIVLWSLKGTREKIFFNNYGFPKSS